MTENDSDSPSEDAENNEDEYIVTTQIRRNVDVEVTAESQQDARELAVESAQEVAPAGFVVSPIIVEYAEGTHSKRIMDNVKRSVIGTDGEPADSVQRRTDDEPNENDEAETEAND
jgi:hypothetical protein